MQEAAEVEVVRLVLEATVVDATVTVAVLDEVNDSILADLLNVDVLEKVEDSMLEDLLNVGD